MPDTKNLILHPVGTVHASPETGAFSIQLEKPYILALQGLDGFSHIQILWWFSQFDTPEARAVVESPKPYKTAPDVLGIFATRSPVRPNPLAVTTAGLLGIDHAAGILRLDWIDAFDGTPVLDLKPYTPSVDRVEAPKVPAWCAHWPKNLEEGARFDWAGEFNF